MPDWTRYAACDGVAARDFDPWHPDDGDDRAPLLYALARQVCAGCPVRLDCARYGLAQLEITRVQGMLGGLTPVELRSVARRLGRPSRPAAVHGTRSRYTAGCRCELCRRANAGDEHKRRVQLVMAG